MNGITDHPFRHIQKKYGRPAVLYTEFTSVTGSFTRDGRLLQDLKDVVGAATGGSAEGLKNLSISSALAALMLKADDSTKRKLAALVDQAKKLGLE